MALGNVTVNAVTFSVKDNSCASLMSGWDAFYWNSGSMLRKSLGCSSDPVVVGTRFFAQTTSTASAGYNVQSISATPFYKMDWFSVPHLLQALLVVAVVIMFTRGYDSGNRI